MTSTVRAIEPDEFPWFDYSRYTFSLGLHDDGEAWLSGHSASEYDPGEGRIVVRGGMAEQARTAYAKVMAIMGAAGLEARHVLRIVENLTAAGRGHYDEAAAVRRELFGDAPAVCVTPVDRLLRPAALLEVEVAAARDVKVHRDDVDVVATESAGVVHLQGLEAAGSHDSVAAQTGKCLERLDKQLAAVELGFEDVVRMELALPAHVSRDEALTELMTSLGPTLPALVVRRPERLREDDQLVAVATTASRLPIDRAGSSSSGAPAVVRAGRSVWLSGATSLVEGALPGGVVAQCEALYQAVIRALTMVGAAPEHLLETIEYVRPDGLADYRGVADVREQLLSAPYPASTGAICSAMDRPDAMLEVAAAARL